MKMLRLAGLVMLVMATLVAPARAQNTIPFVGCQVPLGQISYAAPTGVPLKVNLPAAIASKLALYADNFNAILAPRGWQCGGWQGTQGMGLAVAPGGPLWGDNADAVDAMRSSAVVDVWNEGHTATIDDYGARYFPKMVPFKQAYEDNCQMMQFIQTVTHNGQRNCMTNPSLADAAPYLVPRYPDDSLKYLSDRTLVFITAAYHFGLGYEPNKYDKIPSPPPFPTYGFLALSDVGPGNGGGIVEMSIRLPPDLAYLRPYITNFILRCLPDKNTVGCESDGAFRVEGAGSD